MVPSSRASVAEVGRRVGSGPGGRRRSAVHAVGLPDFSVLGCRDRWRRWWRGPAIRRPSRSVRVEDLHRRPGQHRGFSSRASAAAAGRRRFVGNLGSAGLRLAVRARWRKLARPGSSLFDRRQGGSGGTGGPAYMALGGTVSVIQGVPTFTPIRPASPPAPSPLWRLRLRHQGAVDRRGGGDAGFGSGNTQTFGTGSNLTVGVTLGATGGLGGAGGPVNVQLLPTSAITTWGSGATGVLAQSIGAAAARPRAGPTALAVRSRMPLSA